MQVLGFKVQGLRGLGFNVLRAQGSLHNPKYNMSHNLNS